VILPKYLVSRRMLAKVLISVRHAWEIGTELRHDLAGHVGPRYRDV
jgi:hypothetical protein